MRRFMLTRAMPTIAIAGVLVFVSATAIADEKFEQLARQVVGTSASVKPGDVVVVAGGKHTTELMEAVAVEVYKAGGLPTLFLSTDRLSRTRFAEMPERFLGQEPKYFAEWLKHVDVWIGLPGTENPKAVFADIPEKRMATSSKAARVIWDMLNDAKIRVVSIGYPTAEEAAQNGLEFETYETMHWKAVHTDYRKISDQGNRLRDYFQRAKSVRVTSPHGTDITFEVGNRPIFVNDGIVTAEEAKSRTFFTRLASLPGGSLSFAPLETSANGKVIVPKQRCRFEPLKEVSFAFKNGRLQDFQAAKGAKCFNETMAAYAGSKDMIGSIQIGLNPEWKVIEDDGDFRPKDALGMVTIGIGFNELLGGANKDPGGFSFPIVGATIEIDGRVVIKDGKLMF